MKVCKRFSKAFVITAVLGAVALASAGTAQAAVSPLDLFSLFATSNGTTENPLADPNFKGTLVVKGPVQTWTLDAPYVRSGYAINDLSVTLDSDPQVLLNFAVTSGNVNTTFTFTSALVSFGAIVNPAAVASAAITLTDVNGDGASLTGQYAGNTNAYRADTNLGNYTTLVGNLATGAFLSTNGNGSLNTPISGSVTDISSEFKFVLSRLDTASGTSAFTVVPEPASIIGLAAGLIGLLGFKRRG